MLEIDTLKQSLVTLGSAHSLEKQHLQKKIQIIISHLEEVHLSLLWNELLPTPTLSAKERLNCSVRGVHKILRIKGKHQLNVSGRPCVHSSQQKVSCSKYSQGSKQS